MKSTLQWGVKGPVDVTYSGYSKSEKQTLVYPDSLGTKESALKWAKEHGEPQAHVVRVQVVHSTQKEVSK